MRLILEQIIKLSTEVQSIRVNENSHIFSFGESHVHQNFSQLHSSTHSPSYPFMFLKTWLKLSLVFAP